MRRYDHEGSPEQEQDMLFFWIAMAAVFLLALNIVFIRYFYWGPGGKPPTPEDEAKKKTQPPPTTRPKW